MEDFVSYDIAVKLKEKGFKEKCIAYYWENINERTPFFELEDNMREGGLCILDLLSNHNQSEWSHFIDAPTISQVLKWLREEKDISVEPCATPYNCGYYMIKCKGEIKATYTNNKYKTYELAAIAGIEYVLDNLI